MATLDWDTFRAMCKASKTETGLDTSGLLARAGSVVLALQMDDATGAAEAMHYLIQDAVAVGYSAKECASRTGRFTE